MRDTRKLAAILVSDVVGYSRLAGADEERTLRVFAASAAISSTRQSLPIVGASSNAPATARSSSFAVWSTRSAAPLKCRPAWSSATHGSAAREAHRVSCRRPLGRRGRGVRRRFDGRRRQYRRAAGGRVRPGRGCPFRAPPTNRRATGVSVPFVDLGEIDVQEHRPAGARLCVSRSGCRRRRRPRRALRPWKGVSPRAFPSSCCPSLTSVAIRSRSISSTASLRT